MDVKFGRCKRSAGWVLLSLAIAAGGVAACKASGSASGETHVGPYKVKFKVDTNGGSYDAEGPADVCLEIEWRDSKGASLGTTTVSLPASGQVPAGAVSWHAEEVDCPEPEHTPGVPDTDHLRSYEVFGSPVIFDLVDGGPYGNAAYRFRITGVADVDARTLIEPILRAGPGAAVPSGLEVISYTQFIPENGGIRLLAADTEPFASFQLDWNGQVGYASLGSNSLSSSAGAWSTVEVRMPAGAFNTAPQANSGELQRSTASQPVPVVERATWTWFP